MVPWFGKQTPFSVAQLIAYRLMGYRTLNINWMPFNHRHQMRLVRGLCGILGVHVIWTIHDLSPHSVRFGSREADEAATTDEGNSCVLVRNGENENISNDTGEIAARLRDIYRSRAKDMGERPPEIAEAYSWDARRSPIRRCSIMSWRRERREHAFHAPS